MPKHQLFLLMEHWLCSALAGGAGACCRQPDVPARALGSTAGLGTRQPSGAATCPGKGIDMRRFALTVRVMDT